MAAAPRVLLLFTSLISWRPTALAFLGTPAPRGVPGTQFIGTSGMVRLHPRYSSRDDGKSLHSEESFFLKVARKANVVLAKLSLKDAAWRQRIANQTDSAGLNIADYEGDPNGPATVALQKLTELVEAETTRARLIVESEGTLGIRPKDAPIPGPLGEAERAATLALENIVAAEKERARLSREQGTPQRPKDAPHPEMLGLLGELERGTLEELRKLAESEKERVKGGANFPPAMLPENERSVLGEIESEARALVRGEVLRLQEMIDSGTFAVRPMDTIKGPRDVDAVTGEPISPLARAEKRVLATAETVRAYELARLDQLRQAGLLPERPMNVDPSSIVGRAETVGVGLLRAPIMVAKTVQRIGELMTDALEVAENTAESESRSFDKLERDAEARARETLSAPSSPFSTSVSSPLLETVAEGVTRAPVLLSSVIDRADSLIDETEQAIKEKIETGGRRGSDLNDNE